MTAATEMAETTAPVATGQVYLIFGTFADYDVATGTVEFNDRVVGSAGFFCDQAAAVDAAHRMTVGAAAKVRARAKAEIAEINRVYLARKAEYRVLCDAGITPVDGPPAKPDTSCYDDVSTMPAEMFVPGEAVRYRMRGFDPAGCAG